MYCLFIDSGIEPGVVVLIKGDKAVDFVRAPSKEPSFPFLAIDSLLKKAAIQLENISAIAVGVGPGSFTGVRTSVSVVQAISFARKIPLIAIPSPFRFIPERDGSYIVALDARQGGAFCLIVDVQHGKVQPDFLLRKLSLEALVRFSEDHSCSMVGDENLCSRMLCEITCAKDSFSCVASLCFEKLQKNEYSIGITPDLQYLGATQAEKSLR